MIVIVVCALEISLRLSALTMKSKSNKRRRSSRNSSQRTFFFFFVPEVT